MKKSTLIPIILGLIFSYSCEVHVIDGEDDQRQDQEQEDENKKDEDDERDCRDMIWDFMTYDIAVTVTDKDGNDLINAKNKNSIPHDLIKIVYKDETYALGDKTGTITKAAIPNWRGFRIVPYNTDPYQLRFGEFCPTEKYEGERVTLYLGDKKYNIIFSMYITYSKKSCPTVHRKIWLNGERIPVENFKINIQI